MYNSIIGFADDKKNAKSSKAKLTSTTFRTVNITEKEITKCGDLLPKNWRVI